MAGITLNLSNSFINDERYIGHTLVFGTLNCLTIITATNNRLTNCVKRSLVFLALFFSLITFIPGLICKSIHYLIAGPVAPTPPALNHLLNQSVPSNNPQPQPAPSFTAPISTPQLSLASFAAGDPSLQEEVQKLNSLQSFANEPTLANYFSLLPASRYLVAGRYTYPITYGWSFTTSYRLMEKFELAFRQRFPLEKS